MQTTTHNAKLASGQIFRVQRGPISTTQLVKYAGASGDYNRIHFDQPFATGAGLKGVIAHGMLTMGFAALALGEAVGPHVFLKELSARFLAPVWAGETVDVQASIVDLTETGDAQVELVAKVGETVVLRGKAVAVDMSQQAAAA